MGASAQVPLLAFGLVAVLGWETQGYDEHRGWEVQGGEDGGWEVEQAAAGSQVGGWEVQQQPQYQDLQQQQNPYQQYDRQQQKQFQQFDQQPYDQQQELYGQEKDQQYYAQFRAQIDQIQRSGGRFQERQIQRSGGRFQERNSEPSYYYQGLQGRGVERDDQQKLFGSEREFGELADPAFQFGESDPVFQFAESDPLFHFGKDSVNLGQPVVWEEARKRRQSVEASRSQPADGYFQYINVPAPKEYEFGFNRGNPEHFVSRYEQSKDHRFRTRVRWGDSYGGYGEHYFEYNHGPGYEDVPKYPESSRRESTGYSKYPPTNYV